VPSIFTRIVNGEIPCHKLIENEKYLAFLDLRPINPGHTLVIPKKETDYLFDLEDGDLGGIMVFAKKVAVGLKKAVPCKRIGVMVAGLEVPHAHIHLVPIVEGVHDLAFARAKAAPPEELAAMAKKIRTYLV
jgi:histidine triad (HIT) family protein